MNCITHRVPGPDRRRGLWAGLSWGIAILVLLMSGCRTDDPAATPSAASVSRPMAMADSAVVWRSLPIRSRMEFEQGLPGGEAEQHLQGMTRSVSNPDRIYLSHDCGQVWRSDDNGRSWRHAICEGLYLPMGQSVEVDPVNPDVVFITVAASYNHLGKAAQGLYRSDDAGATWNRVLALDHVDHQRSIQRSITWDPTSVSDAQAKRWYAGFAGVALYRSEDGGRAWELVREIKEHRPLYAVVHHPTRSGVLYLCSNQGLFVSEDGGVTLNRLGDLPEGEVRYLEIDPADPTDLVTTVTGKGLFRSRDGGRTFALVKEFDAQYAVVHPVERNRMYLVGTQNRHMLVTRDGGGSWAAPRVIPLPGWRLGRLDGMPTFRVCPADENVVYTIDEKGDLARFDGTSWRSLGVVGGVANTDLGNHVRKVAIDPRHPRILYAGTYASGLPFLFRSQDAGETWEDVTGNLPRVGVGGLEVHPLTGDVFTGGMAGTRILAPPYPSPQSICPKLKNP